MAPQPRQQRIRDHAAERERRNIRAKALGYSSRDALDRARRRGEAPTRAELATPAGKARADALKVERGYAGRNLAPDKTSKRRDDYVIAGFGSNAEYQRARRDAAAWSAAHSRTSVSQYSPKMSPTRFGAYYRGIIREWGMPRAVRTPGWQEDLKHYIVNVAKWKEDEEYDEDGRYPHD